MNQNRMQQPKIKRILWLFTLRYLAVLLAFALFMVPIYRQTLSIVSQSSIEDSFAMLKEGFTIIDNELVKMQELAKAIRNEQHFVDLVRTSDAQLRAKDYYTMSAAHKFMKTIMLPSDALAGYFYLFENNDLVLTEERIFPNRAQMFEPYLSVGDMAGETWIQALEGLGTRGYLPSKPYTIRQSMSSSPTVHPAIAYTVALNGGDHYLKRDSRMVFLLRQAWILRLLSSDSILESGFVRIRDVQGNTILTHPVGASLPDTPLGTGIHPLRIGGKEMVVLSISESYGGLTVQVGIPMSLFEARIRGIMDLILLYIALACLGGLVMALFLAYRNSRPLSHLLSMAEGVVQKKGKRESEYAYLGRALQKLSTSGDAYRRELESLEEAIKTHWLDKLLSGTPCEVQELATMQQALPLLDGAYCVAVIRLQHMERLHDEHHAKLLQLITADAIRNMPCGVYFHYMLPGCVVAVIAVEKEAPQAAMAAALARCAAELGRATTLLPAIGLSAVHQGPQQLSAGYAQALDALRIAGGEGREVVLYGAPMHTTVVLCGLEDIRHMNEALLAGDGPATQAVMDTIYERAMAQRQLTEDMVRRIYYSIQNTILFAARSPLEGEPPQEPAQGYTQGRTLAELFGELRDRADRFCQAVEQKKRSRNTKLRDDILAYMQANHVDGTLCAASVSAHFQISEKYLFNFVREQTGKSFGDYLLSLRMAHAQELLMHTDMAIGDVGEAVGFHSPNTFYKVFRRELGVSPGTWREANQSKENA